MTATARSTSTTGTAKIAFPVELAEVSVPGEAVGSTVTMLFVDTGETVGEVSRQLTSDVSSRLAKWKREYCRIRGGILW